MSKQSTPILTLTRRLSGTVAQYRFVTPAGASRRGRNTIGAARVAGVSGDAPVDVGTTVIESGAIARRNAKSGATGRGITWVTSGARLAVALSRRRHQRSSSVLLIERRVTTITRLNRPQSFRSNAMKLNKVPCRWR